MAELGWCTYLGFKAPIMAPISTAEDASLSRKSGTAQLRQMENDGLTRLVIPPTTTNATATTTPLLSHCLKTNLIDLIGVHCQVESNYMYEEFCLRYST